MILFYKLFYSYAATAAEVLSLYATCTAPATPSLSATSLSKKCQEPSKEQAKLPCSLCIQGLLLPCPFGPVLGSIIRVKKNLTSCVDFGHGGCTDVREDTLQKWRWPL